MKVPAEFDAIRPYEPEELPEVIGRLSQDREFMGVMTMLFPDIPAGDIKARMRQCTDNLELEKVFAYPLLKKLVMEKGKGLTADYSQVDLSCRHTFISNHRDIILDSALLDVSLLDAHSTTTAEIAIGDNLLAKPWIRDVVRVAKAFIVLRSLTPKEFLLSSRRMADYMHFAIGQKHENIWIAQREGRAKDSNDLTQPSILKMMAMGGEGSLKQRLIDLHLCPLSISYEYDPCDYLKAREFQLKRDTDYRKTREDDLLNMKTGIFGYKGYIHYHCAPCIDGWLESLPDGMPKAEFFDTVARYIDTQIHAHYRLYPCNYIALDMLDPDALRTCGNASGQARYTPQEKEAFQEYLNARIAMIDLPDRDVEFLTGKILEMYANPLRNYLKTL